MTHTTTVAAPAAAQAAAWAAAVAVSMEAHAKAPRVAARLLVLAAVAIQEAAAVAKSCRFAGSKVSEYGFAA